MIDKAEDRAPLYGAVDGAEGPAAPRTKTSRRGVALALAAVTLVAGLSALAVSNRGQGVVVASTTTSLASCDFGCGQALCGTN